MYIEKGREIFKNRFDYSLIKYHTCNDIVNIRCKKHDIVFEQIARYHVRGYVGCSECRIEQKRDKFVYSNDQVILKANEKHNELYKYDLTNYINNKSYIQIFCKIHGWFSQRADAHLRGQGCSLCNKVGNLNESRPDLKNHPAKLYFYRLWNDDEEFYKVGITGTLRVFSPYNFEKISELRTTLYDAFREEQAFLKKFIQFRYTPKIKFGGWTECFRKEIYNIMFPKVDDIV